MSRSAGLLVLLGLFLTNPLRAQEAGDARSGQALARGVCAACHAVAKGQTSSPDPNAPSFEQLAHVPGMTTLALTVALQTSHATMPNLMLSPDELRDVTAYITSLRESP
jgi:mono/diheme cytochrome c family protein